MMRVITILLLMPTAWPLVLRISAIGNVRVHYGSTSMNNYMYHNLYDMSFEKFGELPTVVTL